MKRYEQIGEALLFLMKDYSDKQKKQIRIELDSYIFIPRKKDDPNPHPNSIKAKGQIKNPTTHLEAIVILINPLYNANTANNVRKYVIRKL